MKQYPSITKEINKDVHIYAFPKFDGSNIRAEYNPKRGFYKFGSRTQLIDEKTMPFGRAITLINDKFSNDLSQVFKEMKCKEAVCFFEYFGPSSFAGNHNFEEDMIVKLIDVNLYNEGFIVPTKFIKHFGFTDIAKPIYEGRVTDEFVESVKNSTLNGMPFEGVVCKGALDNKTKQPVMFKIKSNAWLSKLKVHCKGNQQLFDQLA